MSSTDRVMTITTVLPDTRVVYTMGITRWEVLTRFCSMLVAGSISITSRWLSRLRQKSAS